MGFKGSDCNIELLGEIATKSGGQVDIVDPALVNKNFHSIFADDTIATNVAVTVLLPPAACLQKSTLEADDWNIKTDDEEA